jgi:hypothetical protein
MKVSWLWLFFFCFSWAITCMDTLHLTRSFVWHFDLQYCRSLSVCFLDSLPVQCLGRLNYLLLLVAMTCTAYWQIDMSLSLPVVMQRIFLHQYKGRIWHSWLLLGSFTGISIPLALQLGRRGEAGGRHGAFIWIWKQARWRATGTFGVRARSEIRVRLEVFSRPITWAQLLWAGGVDYTF